MSELRSFSKYGQKQAGVNNKFYEVEAEELENKCGRWTFRWGRIGTAGQYKTGTTMSYALALALCKDQFNKKKKKGYVEVSPLVALASAAQDVSERRNNGRPPVLFDYPNFHAGRSEARCQNWCEKYRGKLNVIRASWNDLGWDATNNQIEALVKQASAEFARMRKSKTHGINLVSSAEIACRIFLGSLVDHSGITTAVYTESHGFIG